MLACIDSLGLFVVAGLLLAASATAFTLLKWLGALRRSLGWLQCAAGALFIGFGLRLALSEAPASSR